MLDSSENTYPTKPIPPKNKGLWLKFVISFSILILLVWLIPYFFSNILFKNIINTTFSDLTNQNYALSFKDLKINLFTGKIILYETRILPSDSTDTIDSPKIRFNSDILMFQYLDIRAWRKNRLLKFKNIEAQKIQLEIKDPDSTSDQRSLNLPLSQYFKGIQVSNFQVTDAQIKLKLARDTIDIPDLSFEFQKLRIDSLSDTVKNNRFHFATLELNLKAQEFLLPDKSHKLSWELLKLSTKKKYFELDNLNIRPLISANNQQGISADIPKLRLEHFEFDSLISKKQLLTKSLILDINRLNIEVGNASLNSNFQEQFHTLLDDNFNKIEIGTIQIGLNKSQLKLPNHQEINIIGKSTFYIDAFIFNPNNKLNFAISDAAFTLNNLNFNNRKSKGELLLDKVQLNYDKQAVSFLGIDYVSDSSSKIALQLEEVQLEKIEWNQLLNADKLLADNLYIKGGSFVQQTVSRVKTSFEQLNKLDSLLFPVFQIIKINTIQIEDWNYRIDSKGFEAKNMNAQLRQFQLPGNRKLAFGIFSAFDSNISELSWVSEDQTHHYLANDVELSSESQNLKIKKIQSFPRWKSLKNELLVEKAHYKLFGENIKLTTQKPFYQIRVNDTLAFTHLSVDSLNIKQFGKNAPLEKLKSHIPPIQIFSFELRKAEFEAYNDRSILNRLAQVNGIHLIGDSLLILNDGLLFVEYKHLLAITKNGFYQNKAQGLSFNFEKLDFDSKEELLGIYQLKTELLSENDEKSSQHQLNSKLLQIKGFDHNMFLQHNLISAHEFNLEAPTIISKSHSDKDQPKINFRELFSSENLKQLPHLEFDRFIVRDFTWLATYTKMEKTSITSFKNAHLEALDFRLSKNSYNDPDRVFFSKSIDFQVENLRQHFQNGNYLLMVDHFGFSSRQKQMNFLKIQFYTLQKAKQNNINFTIDRISLNEINFADFQDYFGLSIDNILIQNPNTKLRLYGFNEDSGIKNLNKLDLYPLIEPYFSFVNIHTIELRDMTLDLETPKENSTNVYNLGHLNLQMLDFRVDTLTKAFQENRFFYSLNTLIHLRNYSAQIAKDLYKLNFTNLRLSTLSGIVNIDSVSLKPLYNYADFANRVQYLTDRFDIEAGTIKLSGIDFQDALFRQKYKIRHAEINRLNGEAYRDGSYPRRTDYYPPNPLQRLLALPYSIQVDSLMVNNSYFAYKELGGNTSVPGHIFFDNMNIQILNATNNPDFIKFGGNTILNAHALLMGKSKLSLDVNFPLLDHGKSFTLNAYLNRIEMDDLDPILRPLALIEARSGTIKSVELSIEANDDYAYGNMLMYYDNMKVDILNKSMKKGFFGTLFANAMIKTENPSYLIPRKGPIYFERNKMRSIFNYWAEISILGMKTSMGLADRRTAKKVKRLKKGKL